MKKEQGAEQRKPNMAAAAVLAFIGTCSLPQMLNLKGNNLAVSNSYFSIFIFAACAYAIYAALVGTKQRDRRGYAAAGILAFAFSVCIAFGVQLDYAENVDFTSPAMWAAVVVWAIILTLWIHRAWELLTHIKHENRHRIHDGEHLSAFSLIAKPLGRLYEKWNGLSGKMQTILLICFFMVCWIPVFLAVYPGFFVYDAQDEFIQMQTRNFTTHHPLPHVLLMGGIILAVNKLTGSYNMGIAAYTLFQMLIMAGVFSYVIYYMKTRGIQLVIRAVSIIYFAFFPVVVMFTLCSAKDGIFTAALLLLLLSMADMVRKKESFFASWKNLFFFGASALVMMCFRHNGMYAFLVMAPVLLIYMKGYRKKLAVVLGAAFGAYFLVTAGLAALLSAEASENQEMLTVPIQQLARAYKYDKDSFSEEDLDTLYEILPEEVLPYYTAKVSDGVKIRFNNEAYAANPGKYMKLWAGIGMKHPFTYLNAWFMTSYGFWYPDTVIDVYRGNGVFTFTYEDSSFFGYEVEQPGTRESKLPWLNEWYRLLSLEITQQRVPVISMLFSPGFLFWVFAFSFGYTYYRRRYHLLIPFVMILLVWLTVILGPTYLPRYVLILWFALPMTAAVLVN